MLTLQIDDEILPILTIAEECSREFPNTSRFTWLVHMARAIYSEPPELLLRPDNSWKLFQTATPARWVTEESGQDVYALIEVLGVTAKNGKILGQKTISIPSSPAKFIDYDKKLSRLKQLIQPLESTVEPAWIEEYAFTERLNRDDFRVWCEALEHPLPRFWFSEEQPKQVVPSSDNQAQAKRPLEAKLTDIVSKLFWESPPPVGHNRPTKTQITDWLMEYAGADGLTEKAAARVYTSSRPGHIPKHGNLPHDKKPFPLPPYPTK